MNGRIWVSFDPDFTLTAGACQGYISGAPISSSSSCSVATKNNLNWLVYNLSGISSTIIPNQTVISIVYPQLISNSLFFKTYTFGI
jgi:hypothetical protein